jgi:DNA polymerase-3 subunit delta
MILKSYELSKINLQNHQFYLFYGENEGLKDEIIKNLFEENYKNKIFRYEEKEILENEDKFFNKLLTKSFFDNEKLIIVSRSTDKIRNIIEEIFEKKIQEVQIILNANILEKKSKLRSFFEKEKKIICVPFYEDNNQTLNSIISQFFRNKNIPISQQLINILIERCRGDRKNLNNELNKIESFSINKKKIDLNQIIKLTNLADNYSANELIDNCLIKNTRKTVTILNENNYSNEDNIIIIRTMLLKLKRLLKIRALIDDEKNVEKAISSLKPPIFWKDKPLVTSQIKIWTKEQLLDLIYETNQIEYLIKKNSTIAKNILADFIINQSKRANN